MNEQLTRREALVAALAATTLGGGALVRPVAAHAAAAAANVGVILPLSAGGDLVAGGNVLKVAKLWTSWVNGRGGVDGQRVALKVYDDMSHPEPAAKAVAQAITRDHCSVILAGWDSAVALAEIEEAHRLGVPFFVSYAWSPDVTRAGYPEVVRIGPNRDMLTSAFLPFMIKRNYTRVALMAEDTAYGRGLGETLRAKATLAGIDVSALGFARDSHDLRPALKRLLPRKPQALLVIAEVTPGRTLAITQARGAGFEGDILLSWDYVDEAFWKATGKHGVGVIWPTFSAPKLELTSAGAAFKRLYTKRYKHAPLIYQAFTWDQLNAWKWAVDTVGSVAPADVVPALPRIDMQGTMGRITLSNQPKTVHFNQWEGVKVYFDQAPKQAATDASAKVLWSTTGETP
ncbi:MAG: branched-chain amino acid transport system substrate-binding protein [Gaiellales bacterium]|nr:branched-chain amino acid transport system substrate-binding protein [Gaiellales bacterium]